VLLLQVTKLMLPHFRYTLNINCNARQSLINEGGTIETGFTPGAYALRLSSAAYKSWRFKQQALPTELVSRWGSSSSSNRDNTTHHTWQCMSVHRIACPKVVHVPATHILQLLPVAVAYYDIKSS
jgi:hypothetical protein